MSIKQIANKYTQVYSCPDDIKNLKIRIKIKEVFDLNGSSDEPNSEWDCKTFDWQIKQFNRFELEFYKNANNCITDLENKYNKLINDSNLDTVVDNYLSCYVDEDDYLPEEPATSFLANNLINIERDSDEEALENEYDYRKSIISSINNPTISVDFERMFLVADFGYDANGTWIKNEIILCKLNYNKNHKILSIYPDFTTDIPYLLQIHNETIRFFNYFIENISLQMPETIAMKETELIQKVANHKSALKKQQTENIFNLPAKNRLNVYLFFEIMCAKKFEYADVYVQYFIDLPENWICNDGNSLSGKTQICYGRTDDGLVHFGHCFDVLLEFNIQQLENNIPKTPYIYFEVISKDTWDRYRTEGLAYKNIPVSHPGQHTFNLHCLRLTPRHRCAGNLRRFFIGDCSSYENISWIGLPQDYQSDTINKYGVNTIGTGELNVRLNIMHQSQAFLKEFTKEEIMQNRERLIFEKLTSSSLIKSVEQVLLDFKKARKNMLEARKKLD